ITTISKQSSQSKTSHEDEDSLKLNSNIHDITDNNNSISTELEPQPKKARKGGYRFDK
ncbi:32298_t:CDS:1, partial [Racocetra persica]